MDEQLCGTVQRKPLLTLADTAARAILAADAACAVTLDPEGGVWVDAPEAVAEVDLVGVYAPALGILGLTRQIRDDLAHEKGLRGLVPVQRRGVGRPRKAA
jgi:hypothetical protein